MARLPVRLTCRDVRYVRKDCGTGNEAGCQHRAHRLNIRRSLYCGIQRYMQDSGDI